MRRDCAVYRSEEAEKGQTKRDAGKRKRGERTEGEAEKDLGKEIQTAERRDGDPVYGMAEPGPVPEAVYPDRALPVSGRRGISRSGSHHCRERSFSCDREAAGFPDRRTVRRDRAGTGVWKRVQIQGCRGRSSGHTGRPSVSSV